MHMNCSATTISVIIAEKRPSRPERAISIILFRRQKAEVRIQKTEVRSQESGVRSQESGVRSQESGTGSRKPVRVVGAERFGSFYEDYAVYRQMLFRKG